MIRNGETKPKTFVNKWFVWCTCWNEASASHPWCSNLCYIFRIIWWFFFPFKKQNFAVELQIESPDELNYEFFREAVHKAGGANYGTGVRELWFLSNLHIYCFSSFLNFVLLIFSGVCLSHQSRWTFALVMLGKKQTSTMYLRSSFHHRSKLAPFFLFYRKLIDEIECIRDLFLLVFESSGLCLSAFIKLQIMFKWFKKFAMAYRRYGCCPHWEFIIVHVDACHLNLNCQPKSAFYCFSIDFLLTIDLEASGSP